MVSSSRHCATQMPVDVPFNGLCDVLIELGTGARVTGRVVEDATGEAVANALVGFGGYTKLALIQRGLGELTPHSKTDRQGRFQLSGLPSDWAVLPTAIAAVHPEFAQGFAYTIPKHGKEIEIRLKEGVIVHGRVRDDGGQPLPGVSISLSGKSVPWTITCRTGADGRYRTGQAEPGKVDIEAAQQTDGTGDRVRFTAETKTAVLADRNVEINFGPSPAHVTYKGVVLDHDGEPLAGASVSVMLTEALDPDLPSAAKGRAICSEQGVFEIRKLVPGSYSLNLGFPRQAGGFEKGVEKFETPGVHEREIRLAELGGAICGIVVDKASGFPPSQDSVGVSVKAWSQKNQKQYLIDVNEVEGSFYLRALPPDRYYLRAAGGDCLSEKFETLDLDRGEIISGVRFEVSFMGTFHLVLNGFGDAEVKNLTAKITSTNRWSHDVPHVEAREHRMPLPPGDFEIRMEKSGLGALVRPFTIEASRTTHMVIDRSELTGRSGDLTVQGKVTYPDGKPAAGIELSFELMSGAGRRKTVAKSDGFYRSSRFEPGRWTIRGDFRVSERCFYFPDLHISGDQRGVLTHDLVIPSGAVKGTICSSLTRMPIDEGGSKWTAWLSRPDHYFVSSSAQNGKATSRFELTGVASGRYLLAIEADGYKPYASEAFELASEERLDVGNIFLDPVGILDLQVVDGRGDPLSSFMIFPADGGEQISRNSPIRDGVCRYEGLPVGPLSLRVESKNYRSREFTVDLLPAKPVTVRVVLEKR